MEGGASSCGWGGACVGRSHSQSHSRSRSHSRIGVCWALSQLHLAAATLLGEQESRVATLSRFLAASLAGWLATWPGRCWAGQGSLLLLLLHVINDDAKRLGHNPLLCAYHNQMLPLPTPEPPSSTRAAPLRLQLLLHLAQPLALCLSAPCDCTRRHSHSRNNNKSDNYQLHCRENKLKTGLHDACIPCGRACTCGVKLCSSIDVWV